MSLKAVDLRKKDKKELHKMLDDLKKEIKNATQELLDGSTKDISKPTKLRRDVARIQTVLNENIVTEEEINND